MAAPTVEPREEHLLAQVLSNHTALQTSETNYSPIKDKDVTFLGDAATQNLTMRRAKDGSLCIKSMCITLHQSMRQGD